VIFVRRGHGDEPVIQLDGFSRPAYLATESEAAELSRRFATAAERKQGVSGVSLARPAKRGGRPPAKRDPQTGRLLNLKPRVQQAIELGDAGMSPKQIAKIIFPRARTAKVLSMKIRIIRDYLRHHKDLRAKKK
jgi:hypothetical protein